MAVFNSFVGYHFTYDSVLKLLISIFFPLMYHIATYIIGFSYFMVIIVFHYLHNFITCIWRVLPKPRPWYFHAPPLPIDSEITMYFQFLIHKSPTLKRINNYYYYYYYYYYMAITWKWHGCHFINFNIYI